MTIARNRIAKQAVSHLNEDAPKNTCMSHGMNRWPQELGLHGIGTDSVSEAKARARAGLNGWEYHEDLDGLQVGDFVDWDPEILGDARDRHVSCVVDIDEYDRVKTVGAGGPTGTVFYQPQSGGFNPKSYFRGFFRVPLASTRTGPVKAGTSPVATSEDTYTVKRGDYLLRVASKHHTTVGRLVALNKLRNADHIEVGQVLKLR